MLMRCALPLAFLVLTACEDPPKAEPTAVPAQASAVPATAPEAAPSPAKATPPAPKPKKTLADCPPGPAVTFEVKELEDEARRKLQKPSGALTTADLKKLKSFNASQVKLDQLDPCIFSHMTGLKELFLGQGTFSDLSPISGATQLESLRASINEVSDLAPLAKLKRLDRLDLGRTRVKDLSPLATLTELTELALDDTLVEDLSPLTQLTKLETLSIQRTKVKDTSPLKGLKKLKLLYAAGTPAEEEPGGFAPVRANGAKVILQ